MVLASSLLIIGKSVGHRSESATRVYARLATDPVRESVEKATVAMIAAASGITVIKGGGSGDVYPDVARLRSACRWASKRGSTNLGTGINSGENHADSIARESVGCGVMEFSRSTPAASFSAWIVGDKLISLEAYQSRRRPTPNYSRGVHVPANNRVGFDDEDRRPPIRPQP